MMRKIFQKSAKEFLKKEDQRSSILDPINAAKRFRLHRYLPSEDLAFFVEHHWVIHWDLRTQEPYRSEVLPFPSVNMVFSPESATIAGVTTGKYSYEVRDQGAIIGTMFRPGGFHPFIEQSITVLTNKAIPITTVFPGAGDHFRQTLLALKNDKSMVACVEKQLRTKKPNSNPYITLINQIINSVITNGTLCTVRAVAKHFDMSERTLQHIFQTYVGVGLKWIIMRYRLQDAAELALKVDSPNWAKIAAELGYSSQSHFINDFKKVIGKSPAQYAKSIRT